MTVAHNRHPRAAAWLKAHRNRRHRRRQRRRLQNFGSFWR